MRCANDMCAKNIRGDADAEVIGGETYCAECAEEIHDEAEACAIIGRIVARAITATGRCAS